jgi:glycosyltransferase involved in cell wall biosynthesis
LESRSDAVSSSLQIVILSRDRPDFLREAVRSVLSQLGEHIEVVVSDNSEREVVARMLAHEFPTVRCIRRIPTMGAFDHFRAIIDGATADLLVMFHDDDVLLEGYVHTLRGHLDADPSLAAACCDASILRGWHATCERFAPGGRGDLQLRRPEDLLREYFSLSPKGPAPFPGYMYRRAAIQGLCLDPRHGGKYSDVSFLLKVLSRGPILWLDEVLMQYRIHVNNDSATEAVGQRLRLLRYVHANTAINHHSPLVEQYRYRYWIGWWRDSAANAVAQPWRKRVVWCFLVSRTVRYALTRPNLWQRLLSKLGRKVQQLLHRPAA